MISSQDTVESTLKVLQKFMDINNLEDKENFLKEIAKNGNDDEK
jgi:hypothetical protein